MTGQRSFDGCLERLRVADLADHDDVRILAQDRPKTLREREAGLGIGLSLIDAGQPVFDRVFNRRDVLAERRQLAEGSVER